MADEDLYRKAEKGCTEITTRANSLGLRERSLLIMVGDKTTRFEKCRDVIQAMAGRRKAEEFWAGPAPACQKPDMWQAVRRFDRRTGFPSQGPP